MVGLPQQLAESPLGAIVGGLDGAGRHAEHLGDLGTPQPDELQLDDLPPRFRQLRDGVLHPFPLAAGDGGLLGTGIRRGGVGGVECIGRAAAITVLRAVVISHERKVVPPSRRWGRNDGRACSPRVKAWLVASSAWYGSRRRPSAKW